MAQAVNNSVAEICAVSELGDDAKALVREGQNPREYLNVLIGKGHFPDAVRFLAHVLPKREAVWWGWICARRAAGADAPEKIRVSLDATEKWIAQPTEEHRRAAMQAAQEADLSTAAGCAGLAAFLSGGSLGPPNTPVVPPGDYLTAKAVASAIIFAAVAAEPEKAPEKFRAFLTQGVDVVTRIRLWEKE
jgi:uncharacterized protein DUF6931